MKPKLDNEPMFHMALKVPASRLGHIIALASTMNVSASDIHLIKEVSASKNLPRGAFKAAIVDILTHNNGSMGNAELKEALVKSGFGINRVHSGIADHLRLKTIVRRGANIHFGKNAGI